MSFMSGMVNGFMAGASGETGEDTDSHDLSSTDDTNMASEMPTAEVSDVQSSNPSSQPNSTDWSKVIKGAKAGAQAGSQKSAIISPTFTPKTQLNLQAPQFSDINSKTNISIADESLNNLLNKVYLRMKNKGVK